MKKNQKITTCNQLNLVKLGSWTIMFKSLPDTELDEVKKFSCKTMEEAYGF